MHINVTSPHKKHQSISAIWEVVFGIGWLIILITGLWFVKLFSGDTLSQIGIGFVIALTFFWEGWLGVIFILRREAHLTIVLRGKSAVFMGVLLICACWSISLYAIYKVLHEIW